MAESKAVPPTMSMIVVHELVFDPWPSIVRSLIPGTPAVWAPGLPGWQPTERWQLPQGRDVTSGSPSSLNLAGPGAAAGAPKQFGERRPAILTQGAVCGENQKKALPTVARQRHGEEVAAA